jgi:hypothetical protein
VEDEKDGKADKWGWMRGRNRMGATVEDDRGCMDEQTMNLG